MIPTIRIVKVPAPLDDEVVRSLMPFVPAEKRDRIRRQKIRQNADNMLAGAVLARYLLWREFRIPYTAVIAYGPYGKPYLLDYPEVHFNISHSGQYVASAVCDRSVGIDIQEIVPYSVDVAAAVCNLEEMAYLKASTVPAREFARIWTKKEAFAKLTGSGIAEGVKDIRFPEDVHFWQFDYDGYMVAAAYME